MLGLKEIQLMHFLKSVLELYMYKYVKTKFQNCFGVQLNGNRDKLYLI